MIFHYAPVERSGVVRDFSVPVSVPDPAAGGEVTGEAVEWVRVVVYETQRQMLAAAREFNGLADVGEDDEEPEEGAWGFTQCYQGPGLMPDDLPRAIIRLCLPALLKTVVLHEVVHATQVVYAWHFLALTEGNPWGVANEDFAYMVQRTWELIDEHMRWGTSLHQDGHEARGPAVFSVLED